MEIKKKRFIVDLNSWNERKKKRHNKIERCDGTTKAPPGQGRRDDRGRLTMALN